MIHHKKTREKQIVNLKWPKQVYVQTHDKLCSCSLNNTEVASLNDNVNKDMGYEKTERVTLSWSSYKTDILTCRQQFVFDTTTASLC